MLRITSRPEEGGCVTLLVEGRIAGAWVAILSKECRAYLASGSRVVLDLRGVTYVGTAGIASLRRLREEGADLRGCSPVISDLILDAGL